MGNRVEDAQTSIRIVSGEQDYFDRLILLALLVETQKPTDERERDTGIEEIVLMLALILAVFFLAALSVNAIGLGQVEEGAGGDATTSLSSIGNGIATPYPAPSSDGWPP
jgi:hypothetical protein